MKKIRLGLVLVLLGLLLVGCSGQNGEPPAGTDEKFVVAVSILPQKTFVEKVAGDLVDVVTMIPPGNNPENYQVKPQDMMVFSKASVYFAVGVEAEKAGLLEKAMDLNPKMVVVRQDQVVDRIHPHIDYATSEWSFEEAVGDHDESDDHAHEGRDTHIWMSPKRAMVMVENIRDQLSVLDPDNAQTYQTNAQSYLKELDQVDEEIRAAMDRLPYKTFLIYHPSMGYFAYDYGLTMVPIEAEGKEATAVRLRRIIDFAREQEVKVVFYQLEHDKNQAQTIAAELGGEVMALAPLAPDYIENLRRIKEVFVDVLQ